VNLCDEANFLKNMYPMEQIGGSNGYHIATGAASSAEKYDEPASAWCWMTALPTHFLLNTLVLCYFRHGVENKMTSPTHTIQSIEEKVTARIWP